MKAYNDYEVIIVGGSYSGLAAGMALGRALRKVLIIDSGNPCNQQTPRSHNFLTNDGKTPKEIESLARMQVTAYGSVGFLNALVTNSEKFGDGFQVQVNTGETLLAKKIVFATGIKDVMADIPGFVESWGISVLHCPYCHGYEVKSEKTGILANGDSGFEFAALLSNWTKELTLYTNGHSTLTASQRAKLARHKIDINEAEIERLEQTNGYIENILFKNGRTTSLKALYARRPFVQHSSLPYSLGCELTIDGYINVDATQKTTVHGVYACGDNTSRMRTIAHAVATGTTAGMMVNKELIEESFQSHL
jgi:thioredoxin reductase